MELAGLILLPFFILILYNLHCFLLEMEDREYRKYLYIKIMILSLSFISYSLILLFYYSLIFLFFILLFFIFFIFFAFKKYLTFNDITFFFMLSLIFTPLVVKIGLKFGLQTDERFMYSVLFSIVFLAVFCLILFLINIFVQFNNSAKRKQQPENKDKPNEP